MSDIHKIVPFGEDCFPVFGPLQVLDGSFLPIQDGIDSWDLLVSSTYVVSDTNKDNLHHHETNSLL